MKLRLWMIAASAVLLLVPATVGAAQAGAQVDAQAGTPPAMYESGHAQMERNANESAQATTDMPLVPTGQADGAASPGVQNTSYGGAAAGQSAAGGPREKTCGSGPRCNVYFGQ